MLGSQSGTARLLALLAGSLCAAVKGFTASEGLTCPARWQTTHVVAFSGLALCFMSLPPPATLPAVPSRCAARSERRPAGKAHMWLLRRRLMPLRLMTAARLQAPEEGQRPHSCLCSAAVPVHKGLQKILRSGGGVRAALFSLR